MNQAEGPSVSGESQGGRCKWSRCRHTRLGSRGRHAACATAPHVGLGVRELEGGDGGGGVGRGVPTHSGLGRRETVPKSRLSPQSAHDPSLHHHHTSPLHRRRHAARTTQAARVSCQIGKGLGHPLLNLQPIFTSSLVSGSCPGVPKSDCCGAGATRPVSPRRPRGGTELVDRSPRRCPRALGKRLKRPC